MEGVRYEYSEPITVYGTKTVDQGGSQGAATGIVLQSPFGAGACEFAILCIFAEAAGGIVISADGQPPVIGPTNEGGVKGFMFKPQGPGAIQVNPIFTTLKNGRLYISLNITNGNASITFAFRRALVLHAPDFEPMYHTADPENEFAVNAARAEAITAASASSTPKRR